MRYFEDFRVGETIDLGTMSLSAEEIMDFARKYDPQPFHTNPEAASSSIYGGLIASGWHTASAFMRLFFENFLAGSASLGSPGLDALRWPRPVRPGDVLTASITIVDANPSRSRPEMGIVRSRTQAMNQRGEVVMEIVAVNFFGRRPG